MGTHTGRFGRGPRAVATGPGAGRALRRPAAPVPSEAAANLRFPNIESPEIPENSPTAPAAAPPGPDQASAPATTPTPTAAGRTGFRYRPGVAAPTTGPLPPLPLARQAGETAAATFASPPVAPKWSPLTVALPLFAAAWVCFTALAATVTAPAEADVAALGHVLAVGAGVVALVLVTLSVAHIQISGTRPRPAAVAVAGLGAAQGLAAAAIGSGPSDLWGLAAQVFLLIGLTVPLAWVGGQFQSGVRRQRVEQHDSLIASWIKRARDQAHQTFESVHRHDVRSMLFVVDAAARALTDEAHPLTDDQRQAFAGMLEESVARLSSLMDVRPEEIQPFSVESAVRAVAHAERKAGRTVATELAPAGLQAVGRAADVGAVLRTLIDVTARGAGAVQIRAEVDQAAVLVWVEPANADPLPLLIESWEEIRAGTVKFSSNANENSMDLNVAALLLSDQGADLWSTAGGDRFVLRLPAPPDSGSQEEA